MQKFFFLIVLLISLNCAKTEYYLKNVNDRVRMTSFSEEEGYKLKKRFELSHTRVNLFWGLANVYKKDLDSILKQEFKNPETEAVGNLTISESYDFFDSLLDWALIGIVRPYTIIIKGNLYEKLPTPENNRNNPNSDKAIESVDEIKKSNIEPVDEIKKEDIEPVKEIKKAKVNRNVKKK